MHLTAHKFAGQVRDLHGFEATIEEFLERTETADDAAVTVDCGVTQVVKSIVMCVDNETVVVLTNGMNRVDETSLGSESDVEQGPVRGANPSGVKAATGWNVDGVPPICRTTDCPVLADPTLEPSDRV